MSDIVKKYIVVLTARVKYPSSESYYLTSSSWVVDADNPKRIEDIVDEFRKLVEQDDFKIVEMVAYDVPFEQIEQVMRAKLNAPSSNPT